MGRGNSRESFVLSDATLQLAVGAAATHDKENEGDSGSMLLDKGSGAIDKAARALGAAMAVAHLAFLSMFGWRLVAGANPFGKVVSVVCVVLAILGLAAQFVGWSLLKFGGRTPARRLGLMAIALSTTLAGVLLFAASFT
jgi:hypothetical protein